MTFRCHMMRGILPPVSVCRMAIPRVDYTYSWSDYLSTIDNRGWRWRSTGDLQTHRLGLSHVLFRNGDMKTALTGGLQHRIIHNYLDDVLLQGSSRKLTSFSVGLNHTHKFLGGVGTLNPVFTRGDALVRRRKRPREKGRPARKSVPEMVGECQFSAPPSRTGCGG